jgi:molybdate transport system substrate-binding protein
VTELARRFEEDTGVRADLNFGGSNALARQIMAGAPTDLFLSAGEAPVDLLVEEGLVSEPDVRELLGNELVVVTRPEGGQPGTFEALLSDRYARVTIVDPGLGPAGRYAEQALRSAGVWDALLPKIILASDVRAVLSYVEAGNADAGIVYRTDAATMPELSVAYGVPSEMHSPIRYLGVVLESADRSEEASRVLEFLTSKGSATEFAAFGFLEVPSKVGQSP